MERPDSVSRVAPPTSTMIAISTATAVSQTRTARYCGASLAETAGIPISLERFFAPLIVRPSPRASRACRQTRHFRHDHSHPQVVRSRCPDRAGGGVVADGHGGGTDACY